MGLIPDRLINQHLRRAPTERPAALVAALGAVQAQDYLAALWAVGLRSNAPTEAEVERALRERQLVRTWPLRGTLHLVAAADVHWLRELLAPIAIARAATRFRQLELEADVIARARRVVAGALEEGAPLTRDALYQRLTRARISPAGQRGIHLLWRLAHEGVLCFGPRHGKQHTFVLLEAWAPPGPRLAREAALAELARRYFTGHGPATLADFVWWSGLPVAEARTAIDLARPQLAQDVIAGQTYWGPPSRRRAQPVAAALLPAFDEYLVGYQGRDAVLDPQHVKRINAGGGLLAPAIMLEGRIFGTWKRVLKGKAMVVTPAWFTPPGAAQTQAFNAAAERYARFLGLPLAPA